MTRFLRHFALIFAFAPAYAEDASGQIPAGCTAHLTVQTAECRVDHYYTCEGEPDGHQWRLSMDRDGPTGLFLVDHEYRWLEAYFYRHNIVDRLVVPETEPASMTELLDDGHDDIRIMLEVTFEDGVTVYERFEGFDRLTGETAVIDGEYLLVTEFSMTHMSESGEFYSRAYGHEYVHPEYRIFLANTETYQDSDGTVTQSADAPVRFLQPGEAGFLDDTPRYGCDALMSSLPMSGGQG